MFISALYGSTFPDTTEAAYANYRLCESLGFCVAYGFSSFLCMSIKLYIFIASATIAALGYYFVEYWNRTKKSDDDTDYLISDADEY